MANQKKYQYGGYLLTGGTLDNGNAWQGVNVMIAECTVDNNGVRLPMRAGVFKGSRTDSLMDFLQNAPIGCFVIPSFGMPQTNQNGKVSVKLQSLELDND